MVNVLFSEWKEENKVRGRGVILKNRVLFLILFCNSRKVFEMFCFLVIE